MLAAILGQPGGDPGSYGGEGRIATAFSQLYALIAGVPLWIVLGGLLLIGAIKGEMPRWAAIGAGVLYPLSGVAAFAAGALSYSYPGGWAVLVPAVLPPLIALYAMWARLPALHAVLRPDATSAALFGAIAAVTLATVPLAYVDELLLPARIARQQEKTEALIAERETAWAKLKQQDEAKFQRLTPDSPPRDYLNPQTIPPGDAGHRHALEVARQGKARQIGAGVVNQGGKPRWLTDLGQPEPEGAPGPGRPV